MDAINTWLLNGDVSIRYQVYRDLLGTERRDLQERISREGWGRGFLDRRSSGGHWGLGFYQPKWTSSHYTLLDLRTLCLPQDNEEVRESIQMICSHEKGSDGGINPSGSVNKSDVCINGMFLYYACYFEVGEEGLKTVVDFILDQRMPDGGFNCRFNRSGARHSSLHSTLSVAEGIHEYARQGYTYRLEELLQAEIASREFILQHRLYKSDKTGEVIDERMTRLSYPCRWRYDILRALDYFRDAYCSNDERMSDALDILRRKQRRDGRWPLQARHPGKTHFEMESSREASRWNTLRALRVLNHFDK